VTAAQMVDVLLDAQLDGLFALHCHPSTVPMSVLVPTDKLLGVCQVNQNLLLLLAYLMVDQATLECEGVVLAEEVANLLVADAFVVMAYQVD
jgi:hypothetical protein